MRAYLLILTAALITPAHTRDLGFPEAQNILQTYCKTCHGGAAHAGGFSLNQIAAPESLYSASNTWNRVMARVRLGEMPPKGPPAPSPEEREALLAWGLPTLRAAACQNGLTPGPYRMRRLSR